MLNEKQRKIIDRFYTVTSLITTQCNNDSKVTEAHNCKICTWKMWAQLRVIFVTF